MFCHAQRTTNEVLWKRKRQMYKTALFGSERMKTHLQVKLRRKQEMARPVIIAIVTIDDKWQQFLMTRPNYADMSLEGSCSPNVSGTLHQIFREILSFQWVFL